MNIGIIGTGFVGYHLYQNLKDNHDCLCSVKSKESFDRLTKINVPTTILNSSDPDSINIFIDRDILVISVAAKNEDYNSTYLNLAKNIHQAYKNFLHLKQIIVISSTSVYLENKGNLVTEDSPLNFHEEKPKILIETENTYLNLKKFGIKVCILRLGEIYGSERYLKSKLQKIQNQNIPGDGTQFANLIHIEDITNAINFAISSNLDGIFNLVCDDHPTRKALYETLSKKYNYHIPLFRPDLLSYHGKSKIVSNQKIKSLGLNLVHPHIVF